MTEQELLDRWNSEQPIYRAWGDHVQSRVKNLLSDRISPIGIDLFLRVPPKPRLKGDASFLEKAFYRGKNYKEPFDQITDKVGVRFVVLLGKDIQQISHVIENCADWTWSKDRDYEDEQRQKPVQFEYAAVHYILRCRSDLKIGELVVPAEAPCEVQIKTILQHAYSELTHDTLYKPAVIASAGMKRSAAKSMALLEATGDYFNEIVELVDQAVETNKQASQDLSAFYEHAVKAKPEVTRAEGLILEAFEELIGSNIVSRVSQLVAKKPWIARKVEEGRRTSLLFRQPSILAVYTLINEQPAEVKARWPLTPEELRPLYTQFGLSFDNC